MTTSIDHQILGVMLVSARLFLAAMEGVFGVFIANVGFFKILGAFLSVALLFGIFYAMKRGSAEMSKMRNATLKDALGFGALPHMKKRSIKAWENVKGFLKEDNQDRWKLAVIEADRMFEDLLEIMGYRGKSMDERLNHFLPGQLSNASAVKEVHAIAVDLVHAESPQITRDGAERAIKVYQKAFEALGILDPEE
jgi:hypothetical protein